VSFTGTVSITGSVTASGPFTDSLDGEDADGQAYASCADWANDLVNGQLQATLDLPSPQAIPGPAGPIPADGTVEQAQLILDGPWPGPGVVGNVSGETTKGLTESASIIIQNSGNPANFTKPATWSVTVNADGSGKMTFTDAQGTSGTTGTVSGNVTWTCS
jgi:hypothetical protein